MVLTFVATALAPLAASADCGDDVAGQRIPCECGDIVASSTRLQPGDPVVAEPCAGDGLLLRPPSTGAAIVLDLNGQEIRGSGSGAGILVLPGGGVAVEIVGGAGDMRAVLSRFRNGIRAMAEGALARVANVTVRDSTATGVAVRGSATALEGVRIEGGGGDGLRASGRSVTLEGVEVEGNRGRGVVNRARNATTSPRARGTSE